MFYFIICYFFAIFSYVQNVPWYTLLHIKCDNYIVSIKILHFLGGLFMSENVILEGVRVGGLRVSDV